MIQQRLGLRIGFQVNSYTTNDQSGTDVAIDAQGNFVVVWGSYGSYGTDTSDQSIQGQRYDAEGNHVGGEFEVNSYTTSYQVHPSVAVDAAGYEATVGHEHVDMRVEFEQLPACNIKKLSTSLLEGPRIDASSTIEYSFPSSPSTRTEVPMLKNLLALLFVVVCSPVFGQEIVQVFVTSSDFETNGNLGGVDGGDDVCNDAASAEGLAGNWTAWLSDTTADASDRIPDAEYRRLDGVVVANDLDDLTDGSLDNPINVDETGAPLPGEVKVWTGTRTDGTVGLSHCSNWTSDTGVTCAPGVPNANCAFKGSSDATDGQWTAEALPGICAAPRALYCFSEQMSGSDLIFADGFESGDHSHWSSVVP